MGTRFRQLSPLPLQVRISLASLAFHIFTTMKYIYILVITAFVAASCGKSGEQTGHEGHDMSAMESDSTNTILYNQVMDIHDEVMPKMNDLYNITKDLKAKAEAASGEEKAKLEARIAKLDSAGKLMMDWMHEFNPPADTSDVETSRAYLEGEMEKVKRVKEGIDDALKAEGKN